MKNCVWVEPILTMGYLLMDHESMNGYLYERKLSETEMCDCGKGREDWMHVLTECEYYEDIRDLNGWGVVMRSGVSSMSDRSDVVDVSRVLIEKEK